MLLTSPKYNVKNPSFKYKNENNHKLPKILIL